MTDTLELSGESGLCAAVIECALDDLRHKDLPWTATAATLRHRIDEQRSAVAFFTHPDSHFRWMVAAVSLNPDAVVSILRGDLESTQKQIDRMMERVGEIPAMGRVTMNAQRGEAMPTGTLREEPATRGHLPQPAGQSQHERPEGGEQSPKVDVRKPSPGESSSDSPHGVGAAIKRGEPASAETPPS